MSKKTEEYIVLANRTADSLSQRWERLGGIFDYGFPPVQVQLPGTAHDLRPAA